MLVADGDKVCPVCGECSQWQLGVYRHIYQRRAIYHAKFINQFAAGQSIVIASLLIVPLTEQHKK